MFLAVKQIYGNFELEFGHSKENFQGLNIQRNYPIQTFSRTQLISAAAEFDVAENKTNVDAKRNPALLAAETPGNLRAYTLENHKPRYKTTPLHFACFIGHFEEVELNIKNGADIEARDDYGVTALHLASGNGHKRIVKFLLRKRANCNPRNRHGVTPLHFAAEEDHLDVLQYLISKGAYFNARTKEFNLPGENSLYVKNWTPLICSINNKRFGVMKVLLQIAVSVNSDYIDSLRIADAEAFCIAVEFLISIDKHVKQVGLKNLQLILKLLMEKSNELGPRCIKLLELLIERGMDINFKYKDGKTALHYAVINEQLDMVKLLLANKADLNTVDYDNFTPLHYSLRVNAIHDTSFADILLEHGCSRTTRLNCLNSLPWSLHIGKHVILYHLLCNPEETKPYFLTDALFENWKSDEHISLSEFWNSCLLEIYGMMRNFKGKYSIYIICVQNNHNRLALYTANKYLHRYCKSDACKTDFPIYENLILKKFEQGNKRRELIGRLHRVYVYSKFQEKISLYRECWLNIAQYLSNYDMLFFIKSLNCEFCGLSIT